MTLTFHLQDCLSWNPVQDIQKLEGPELIGVTHSHKKFRTIILETHLWHSRLYRLLKSTWKKLLEEWCASYTTLYNLLIGTSNFHTTALEESFLPYEHAGFIAISKLHWWIILYYCNKINLRIPVTEV